MTTAEANRLSTALASAADFIEGRRRGQPTSNFKPELKAIRQASTYLKGNGSHRIVEWSPIDLLKQQAVSAAGMLVVASCEDGRCMIWRADNLLTAQEPKTPEHLRFPATRWMPLANLL